MTLFLISKRHSVTLRSQRSQIRQERRARCQAIPTIIPSWFHENQRSRRFIENKQNGIDEPGMEDTDQDPWVWDGSNFVSLISHVRIQFHISSLGSTFTSETDSFCMFISSKNHLDPSRIWLGHIEYTIRDHLDHSQIQINYPEKKIVDFADFRFFLSWGVWTGDNP